MSIGQGCPRYCQIRINRELSLAKGNNSSRHDAIWAILKLEDIMVLNNVTKFHKLRAITPKSMAQYRPLSNLKNVTTFHKILIKNI